MKTKILAISSIFGASTAIADGFSVVTPLSIPPALTVSQGGWNVKLPITISNSGGAYSNSEISDEATGKLPLIRASTIRFP